MLGMCVYITKRNKNSVVRHSVKLLLSTRACVRACMKMQLTCINVNENI